MMLLVRAMQNTLVEKFFTSCRLCPYRKYKYAVSAPLRLSK